MFSKLQNLNIELDNFRKEQFKKYIKYFICCNKNVNLISKNDVNLLFEKHIYDSLAFNLFYEKYIKKSQKIKLLDIGTGGGFPSVPLAVVYPELNITAVDSINKKIKFLKQLKEYLGLTNFHPVSSRAEELPFNMRNSQNTAVSRAMAELRIILEYAIPFVKTNGYFLSYKSKKADYELKCAKNALSLLNTVLTDKIEYKLPLKEDNTRFLLVFQKLKDTDKKYPRKNGAVKNNPL